KTAKLLGLGYPGGPALERAAARGNPKAHRFPRPLLGRDGADFSFAGLKTAVAQTARAASPLTDQAAADIAASFQAAIADCLIDRARHAMQRFKGDVPDDGANLRALVVAGGVAANKVLRSRLSDLAAAEGFAFAVPPLPLCTDNAAMIAWAGIERFEAGLV